jgi:uncharacterized protein YyaL (SSP411 family)
MEDLIEWRDFEPSIIDRAKEENRAIFIFIYSKNSKLSERMQDEIFSNKDIANILNREFISIKIDRYIRVDLFKYYKEVYKLINRKESNEPLCIFATSEFEPFYAFGYLPLETRGNILGFRELLNSVVDRYKNEKDILVKNGREILSHLNRLDSKIQATKFDLDILTRTLIVHIDKLFDREYGGFGEEIKFLNSSVLDLMFCLGDSNIEKLALFTLREMANSKVFNRDSGIFYRYATREWNYATSQTLNYQNALLAKLYIRAYLISKESIYREVGELLLDNLKLEDITSLDAIVADGLLYGSILDSRYKNRAIQILDTLLDSRYKNRKLFHTSNVDGFLEDYAYLGSALLSAYRFSDNRDYLIFAQNILNLAIERFYKKGRWRFSDYIEVYEDIYDIDYPSSISVLLELMESIGEFVEENYSNIVFRTFEVNSYNLMRQPLSSPNMTKALLIYLRGDKRC